MITIERLRQVLDYDAQSGVLRWLISSGKAKAGKRAGCVDGQGYTAIKVEGRTYLAHRLAWAHFYGVWPDQIDHRNGHRSDNAIANLRNATRAQNNRNVSKASQPKSSRYKGVCWCKTNKRWSAYIRVDRRLKNLGRHVDELSAARAYDVAAKKFFGPFARLNLAEVGNV